MEAAATVLMILVLGGFLFGIEQQRQSSQRRTLARKTPSPALPGPAPAPTPGLEPGPTPAPMPAPTPTPAPPPEPKLFEIPEDTWKDYCWWTMDSPADVNLELHRRYITTWPSEWQGAEDHRVYVDPPDLADVEATGVWENGELYLEIEITPKRRGWGTLMATEGTPGPGAVKGETPWRAECMMLEVI